MSVHWVLKRDGTTLSASLVGAIDEDSNLQRLVQELGVPREIRLDLAGISRVNSSGVREWLTLMRSMPERTALVLERCSPAVVAQINMISNFAGKARIASILAPFSCDACGHEERVLFEFPSEGAQKPDVSARPCPLCGKRQFAFEEAEESYFAFLG